MTTSHHGTVVCPGFIGRHLDLNELYMSIDREISGHGQAVLLCGEAGIGKSRLVAEAKTYAFAHGLQVLQGNCFQTWPCSSLTLRANLHHPRLIPNRRCDGFLPL